MAIDVGRELEGVFREASSAKLDELLSRILGGGALAGGMPVWKYVSNRFLTAAMNLLMGAKLSEYHTGYRAFSRELIEKLPLDGNSDDFAFDAQMLSQILFLGRTIAEVSCPTVYFPEASSINFRRSCTYGFACLAASLRFRLARLAVPAPLPPPWGRCPVRTPGGEGASLAPSLSVIANQCAHWCGNPYNPTKGTEDADCHVAALLAMTPCWRISCIL